jgi:hypothetical protein
MDGRVDGRRKKRTKRKAIPSRGPWVGRERSVARPNMYPLAKSNPAWYTDRHKGDMVRPGEVAAITLRRIRPSIELGPWAASLARNM